MWKAGLSAALLLLGASLSHAAGPFDGRYSGQATWAGNGNVRCTSNVDFSVVVTDSKFLFGPADSRVTVTVGADGSFSGQSGSRSLQGRIQGSQMTATLAAERCNYMWSLRK